MHVLGPVRCLCIILYLMDSRCRQIAEYLEKFSVEKLGELHVDDSAALAALKEGNWLTLGAETAELDWQSMWLRRLDALGGKKKSVAGGPGKAVAALRCRPPLFSAPQQLFH